jgi:hypothetical protein
LLKKKKNLGGMTSKHLTMAELEAGLREIRQAPKDDGRLELIVRRPQMGERDVLEGAELSLIEGLIGDNWRIRGSSRTAEGAAHPNLQVTIMSARAISLLAGEKDLWRLAGDQLFIDIDLSAENAPPGTKLAVGSAVIEVTDEPHTGCKKFAERFGVDALQFVNSAVGRELRLRGINAKVVQPGMIRVGDVVKKI